jgi:hypothetical protein
LEGLRLSESYWFVKTADEPIATRDRVWNVLVDIVNALVQCRINHIFFHRSVYRHAQALMWAPILDDPIGQRTNGSLGEVSATKAVKLRGVNSTSAVSSALTVISTLFEKRRSQLCAVWVSNTTSATPFDMINSTGRKYDTVRGKYISAYIEAMRLCDQRVNLESFLRTIYSTHRDLPSFFAASAAAHGGVPQTLHSEDPLLVQHNCITSCYFLASIKRTANGALASTICRDIHSKKTSSNAEHENNLKSSYACFKRLNCTPEELIKNRSRKNLRSADGIKFVVDAVVGAFLKFTNEAPLSGIQSNWSCESQAETLLRVALAKCKTLYPNMSNTFYFKKRAPRKRKVREEESNSVKKSFDVSVPNGLSSGDTFVVKITLNGQPKRVRLTVPENLQPGQLMRFSLDSSTFGCSQKKAKPSDDSTK